MLFLLMLRTFENRLNLGSGKSRFIPALKGRIGLINVGAARHDKLKTVPNI